MTDQFICEWDGGAQATVRAESDGYVELVVQRLNDDPETATHVTLTPESARRFARTVTLASIAADGEDAPTVPESVTVKATVPCPNDNSPCSAACRARPDCHRTAVEDLFRTAEPATNDEEFTREELFLAARDLAGPAAGLDDVLKVAAYLAT